MTKEASEEVRAAGCVLWRPGPKGVEVLVAHRDRYDDWTFPKGKRDPGETDEETAVREVAEETNLRGKLGAELTSTSYVDNRGRAKVVRYWLMRYVGGDFVANDEVGEVRWLDPVDAAGLLSYERDVDLLTEAVRHLS